MASQGHCTHTFPVRTTTGPSHREWRENVNIPREETRTDTASTVQIQSHSTAMEKARNGGRQTPKPDVIIVRFAPSLPPSLSPSLLLSRLPCPGPLGLICQYSRCVRSLTWCHLIRASLTHKHTHSHTHARAHTLSDTVSCVCVSHGDTDGQLFLVHQCFRWCKWRK